MTRSAGADAALRVQQLNRGRLDQAASDRWLVRADGTATVTYPRLTKRGTYKFRVVVDGVATKRR